MQKEALDIDVIHAMTDARVIELSDDLSLSRAEWIEKKTDIEYK